MTTGVHDARFTGDSHGTMPDQVRGNAGLTRRNSPYVGRSDKALDAAPAEHWIVIDMARDWNVIYPFEKK